MLYEVITVNNDTTPTILDVLLRDLTLSNITLHYNDESTKTRAKVHIPKIKLKGKVRNNFV